MAEQKRKIPGREHRINAVISSRRLITRSGDIYVTRILVSPTNSWNNDLSNETTTRTRMMVFLPGVSRRMPTERERDTEAGKVVEEGVVERILAPRSTRHLNSARKFWNAPNSGKRAIPDTRTTGFYADPRRGSLGHSSDIRK